MRGREGEEGREPSVSDVRVIELGFNFYYSVILSGIETFLFPVGE